MNKYERWQKANKDKAMIEAGANPRLFGYKNKDECFRNFEELEHLRSLKELAELLKND